MSISFSDSDASSVMTWTELSNKHELDLYAEKMYEQLSSSDGQGCVTIESGDAGKSAGVEEPDVPPADFETLLRRFAYPCEAPGLSKWLLALEEEGLLTAETSASVAQLFGQYCERFGSRLNHKGKLKSLHLEEAVAKLKTHVRKLPACILLAALTLIMVPGEAETPEEIEEITAMRDKYMAISKQHDLEFDDSCLSVAEIYENELVKGHWTFHNGSATKARAILRIVPPLQHPPVESK